STGCRKLSLFLLFALALALAATLHRLLALVDADRRSGFEFLGQFTTSSGGFVFDDIAPQTAQGAEEFFFLCFTDVELVKSFDKVLYQRAELAPRNIHMLVSPLHIQSVVLARAARGEADEVFEVGEQTRSVGLGELLIDASVAEH